MPNLTWTRSRCGRQLIAGGFVIRVVADRYVAHYAPRMVAGEFLMHCRSGRVGLGTHANVGEAKRACEAYAAEREAKLGALAIGVPA